MAPNDKVTFTSGATSSAGHDYPYHLMTHCAEKLTALRFGAGNKKHENDDTVLANANWLKAFHSRDLEFFRNRYTHARDHMDAEMQGRFDDDPGGNIGAVGWFIEVLAYVKEYDPDFYSAVVGVKPHPGKREKDCFCPRCKVTDKPHESQAGYLAGVDGKARLTCPECGTRYILGERHGCFKFGKIPEPIRPSCRHCKRFDGPDLSMCCDCSLCTECCVCL